MFQIENQIPIVKTYTERNHWTKQIICQLIIMLSRRFKKMIQI